MKRNKLMEEVKMDTAAKILNAAEEEFMEKGYGNAKMMSIAARAGVSHSMLHYYYRSKENLFQTVFKEKAQLLAEILEGIYNKDLSLKEIISQFIRKQFNLMMENDRFIWFIIDELIHNEENLMKVIDLVRPKLSDYLFWFNGLLEKETEEGHVRSISVRSLIMDIISLNASSFLCIPALKKLSPELDLNEFLLGRREENVEFIWNAIKNDTDQ